MPVTIAPRGDVGPVGPVGPKGPMGDKGLSGDRGPVGAKGARGDQGLAGAQGAVGPRGPAGGAKGDTGPQGPKGDKGDTGSATPGNAIGDIQYWNGSSWILRPIGEHGSILMSCGGVPTWVSNRCPSYSIGGRGPAGGTVFYVTDSGVHGLEAAPEDLGPTVWGCGEKPIPDAENPSSGISIGLGSLETAAIISGCSDSKIAARLASDYTLNGYSDWFLPSWAELGELYKLRDILGDHAGNHWSSTQLFDVYALCVQGNYPTYKEKDLWSLYVRPVRSF